MVYRTGVPVEFSELSALVSRYIDCSRVSLCWSVAVPGSMGGSVIDARVLQVAFGALAGDTARSGYEVREQIGQKVAGVAREC
jgi:hypothetical protein